MTDPDAPFMDRVFELSRSMLSGKEIPIAAIICDNTGTIIAEGVNTRETTGDPTAHAEINALRTAALAINNNWRLDECTIYITIEPCTMCAGAINLARINRVVFGAQEPKTGAVGSLWDALRDPRLTHKPAVRSLYRAQESAQILHEYFTKLRTL